MSIEHESAPNNHGPDDDWAGQIRRAKSEKRSKKWIGAAAASGVVLALTVGGATLVNVMGGGGPQPEESWSLIEQDGATWGRYRLTLPIIAGR